MNNKIKTKHEKEKQNTSVVCNSNCIEMCVVFVFFFVFISFFLSFFLLLFYSLFFVISSNILQLKEIQNIYVKCIN